MALPTQPQQSGQAGWDAWLASHQRVPSAPPYPGPVQATVNPAIRTAPPSVGSDPDDWGQPATATITHKESRLMSLVKKLGTAALIGIVAFATVVALSWAYFNVPMFDGKTPQEYLAAAGAQRPGDDGTDRRNDDPIPGCQLDGVFYEGTCPPTTPDETQAPDDRYSDIDCPDGTRQIEWSSAGPAPQTKNDAANLLDTDPRDLTILTYPCPGNEVAIGWVVGTSDTEKDGKIQHIGFVPAGTCVDYDEGPSQVNADLAHHQKFDAVNDRSLVASDGSARGLKFTVYWTPCVFTDGYADDEDYDAPDETAAPTPDGNDGGNAFECPLGDPDAFIDAVVVNLDPDKDGIDADINSGEITDNGYLLTSGDQFRVTRPNSHWVLHTTKYPRNPGLPVDAKETVTKVSVYCE